MKEFVREGIVRTRPGQSETSASRQRPKSIVRALLSKAIQNAIFSLLGVMALVNGLSAQVLTPEILATVPIVPVRLETQEGSRVSLLGKCAMWRDTLVGIEENGDSLVFWEPDSMRLLCRVVLPSELTPVSHISTTPERRILACLIGRNPPYTYTELVLTGTANAGYRLRSARQSSIPLLTPDGTTWRSGVITAWTLAPDGQAFWVAAAEGTTTGKKSSLWKFRKTNVSGADVKWVAEEVFHFAHANQETFAIGGLVWWPSGLLAAATPHAPPAQTRPSVTLVLLPWGNGSNTAVVARGMAKGLVCTDLADSPATLWLILWDPARGKHAVAPIPKVYHHVR